jgi:hypothetical protein
LIVYRVEHQSGTGPVASGLALIHYIHARAALKTGGEPQRHGSHISTLSAKDGLEHGITQYDRLGCASLKDLKSWFPSRAGCAAMTRAGGVLVTYSVAEGDVSIGAHRVAFDARFAVRLSERPVGDLHTQTGKKGRRKNSLR